MKQLENAFVASGLVQPSQTITAKLERAAARKAAQSRRSALIRLVMPSGELFKALAKARKGKKSTKVARAAIEKAQAEISDCNVVLRGRA